MTAEASEVIVSKKVLAEKLSGQNLKIQEPEPEILATVTTLEAEANTNAVRIVTAQDAARSQ